MKTIVFYKNILQLYIMKWIKSDAEKTNQVMVHFISFEYITLIFSSKTNPAYKKYASNLNDAKIDKRSLIISYRICLTIYTSI